MGSGLRITRNTLSPGLRRTSQRYPAVVGAAMRTETEIEATEAKRRTPVDTGNLRSTVHAEGPFFEGKRIYTMICAGGPSAPYAWIVHEDLEALHKVGQAKYIESVIMEARAWFAARVARRIQLQGAVA